MRDERLAPYRAPALAFAGFLLLQAASAAALFVLKLGATPARMAEHYLGAEARFQAPRSLDGILEVAVPHLVAIPLVLFAVAHVVGAARLTGPRLHRALLAVSFGCALAGILAVFGIRFVAPWLAWVKIAAFVGLETALVAWAGLLATIFLPAAESRSAASPPLPPGRPEEAMP